MIAALQSRNLTITPAEAIVTAAPAALKAEAAAVSHTSAPLLTSQDEPS